MCNQFFTIISIVMIIPKWVQVIAIEMITLI
jgi:hypothetical protein